MKLALLVSRWNSLLLNILRIMLVCFVLAVLVGIKFPFTSGDKSNFIALIHMGVAVGIVSNWRFIFGLKWNDPINIIGSILGVAATLVIVFSIKDVKMPYMPGYKTAFQVLGVLLIVKIALKITQDRKDGHIHSKKCTNSYDYSHYPQKHHESAHLDTIQIYASSPFSHD